MSVQSCRTGSLRSLITGISASPLHPSRSVLLRLFLQAPYRSWLKFWGSRCYRKGVCSIHSQAPLTKELGMEKSCSATAQILELPALAGILEEAARLTPLARGCALGGASSHIPARGLSPLPAAQAHMRRTCCAAGICRGDTAEFPAVTQAMPRSR